MDIIKHYLKGWKTIPNLLSFIRILLVPVFAVLFYKGMLGWAVALLVISGLSDFFDGKIARKFNQISELGKMLDPLADKITQITIAILLFLEFRQCESTVMRTFSWIFFVFLAKEFIFVVGGLIMIAIGIVPGAAEIYGKVATFVFYLVMVAMFLFGPEIGVFRAAFVIPDVVCVVLVAISAVLALVAFASYLPEICRKTKERFAKNK